MFVSLSTGAGKPLCYSLLPKVYNELRQTLYRHGTTDLASQQADFSMYLSQLSVSR